MERDHCTTEVSGITVDESHEGTDNHSRTSLVEALLSVSDQSLDEFIVEIDELLQTGPETMTDTPHHTRHTPETQ